MYNISSAVKTHIERMLVANPTFAKTVKMYQGELKDLKILSEQVPAIYIVAMEARPVAEIPEATVDLITVTRTGTDKLNHEEETVTDLQVTENLYTWLGKNPRLLNSTGNVNTTDPWIIDLESLYSKVLAVDKKYTITQTSLILKALL